MSTLKSFKLSDICIENLEKVKQMQGLKSLTAAIEFSSQAAISNQDIADLRTRELEQLEQLSFLLMQNRKDSYLLLDMLNVISLGMELPIAPAHHDMALMSPALIAAHTNYEDYVLGMQARRKTYNNEVSSMPNIKSGVVTTIWITRKKQAVCLLKN